MRHSKTSLVLCFCLFFAMSDAAMAGKKQSAPAPEPVRAEGAFYPDDHVQPPAAAPEEVPYDPYLVAGIGGLFTAAIAGGLAFVIAGRRFESRHKRVGAR